MRESRDATHDDHREYERAADEEPRRHAPVAGCAVIRDGIAEGVW